MRVSYCHLIQLFVVDTKKLTHLYSAHYYRSCTLGLGSFVYILWDHGLRIMFCKGPHHASRMIQWWVDRALIPMLWFLAMFCSTIWLYVAMRHILEISEYLDEALSVLLVLVYYLYIFSSVAFGRDFVDRFPLPVEVYLCFSRLRFYMGGDCFYVTKSVCDFLELTNDRVNEALAESCCSQILFSFA